MKIAIAGYGIEGKANLEYWQAQGHEMTVLDERDLEDLPADVSSVIGPNAFDDLGVYDLVIRTASLPPNKLASAKKIWSATNEFFVKCPALIVGVTGTKGKGTTASLITSILRSAGRTVHLVGNIGVPALDVLSIVQPGDIVVYEMSSFQLWDIEKSPHVAVVGMIEPDHLNIHTDMDEYTTAKSRIAVYQNEYDIVIYHPTNPISKQIASAGKGQKARYGVKDDGQVYLDKDNFCIQDRVICSLDELKIPGMHNVENACAAISVALQFTENLSAVAKGLASFSGLPHRLKYVKTVDKVKYYDDSYSSAPGATIAAVKSFSEPEIVILGGFDKNVDFVDLVDALGKQDNFKKALLIGQTREMLAGAFDKRGFQGRYEIIDSQDFSDVVRRARDIAEPGDVVILSPACASFDMFKNFTERGERFVELVNSL